MEATYRSFSPNISFIYNPHQQSIQGINILKKLVVSTIINVSGFYTYMKNFQAKVAYKDNISSYEDRKIYLDIYGNFGIMEQIYSINTTTTKCILEYTRQLYNIGQVHQGGCTMEWVDKGYGSKGFSTTASFTMCMCWYILSTSSTPMILQNLPWRLKILTIPLMALLTSLIQLQQ